MIINPIDSNRTNIGSLVRKAKFYYNRALLQKSKAELCNIYFATVHKCGSQWVNAVFSDKRISEITKLAVYPQHHYDINDFRMQFPRRAFIAGLYIDYPLYDVFINKPELYKSFFVYRDPRDLVVSWYWSAKETHGLNRGVRINRERLNALSQDDGLLYAINYLIPKFAAIRSWLELGGNDSNVRLIKFEELMTHPEHTLTELLHFFGYEVSDKIIKEVAADYSKDKMREKDVKGKINSSVSHYRKMPSTHKGMFKEVHYQKFYEVTGNLVESLGYTK